jgi:hypothetical protein
LATLKYLSFAILTVVLSLPASGISTKIYVWRNPDGVLVYSDSPKPDAEEIEVKNPNTMSSSIEISVLDINPKIIDEQYQVEISQPENNSTIRDNTGSVYISGRIKPIFKKGLKIQLLLDNQPYNTPQSHSMFVLRNIDRGEHQLKMDLITFYMHRASVN